MRDKYNYQLPLCDINTDLRTWEKYCDDNISWCHLNLGNLEQILVIFETYLDLMNMKFTITGVTETCGPFY